MNKDTVNNIINKGRDFAEHAGNKGKELIEIAKIEFSINDVKGQINKLYKEIGIQAYKDIQSGSMSYSDEIIEISKNIDRQKILLLEYKERLVSTKRLKVCPNCGKNNESENKYCGACGYSL